MFCKTKNEALAKGGFVFEEEVLSGRARSGYFVVKSESELMSILSPGSRVLHETVQGDLPCRLFMDIDGYEEGFDIANYLKKVMEYLDDVLFDILPYPEVFSACRPGKHSYHVIFDYWVERPEILRELMGPFAVGGVHVDICPYPTRDHHFSFRCPYHGKPDGLGHIEHYLQDVDGNVALDFQRFVKGLVHYPGIGDVRVVSIPCVRLPVVLNEQSRAPRVARMKACIPDDVGRFFKMTFCATSVDSYTINEDGYARAWCRGVCLYKKGAHKSNRLSVFSTRNGWYQTCTDDLCRGVTSVLHDARIHGDWLPSPNDVLKIRLTQAMCDSPKVLFTWGELHMDPTGCEFDEGVYKMLDGSVGFRWACDVLESVSGTRAELSYEDVRVPILKRRLKKPYFINPLVPWCAYTNNGMLTPHHVAESVILERLEVKWNEYRERFGSMNIKSVLPEIPEGAPVICAYNGCRLPPKVMRDLIFSDMYPKLYRDEQGLLTTRVENDLASLCPWSDLVYFSMDLWLSGMKSPVYLIFQVEMRYTPPQYVYLLKVWEKMYPDVLHVIWIRN